MKIIDAHTIELDRELSELDVFVLHFVKILEKYAQYVLISGYVAILFGRTRTTEDVDLFIEKISKEKAIFLYDDLMKHDFWALNVNSGEEFHSYLSDNIAVRFARRGRAVPNLEVKFVKDMLDMAALQDRTKVITAGGELWVSNIEMQIAYKRFVLRSDKDLEDARHLQNWFSIPNENINKYKLILKEYGRI